MQNPVPVTELQSTESHGHPAFDVRTMENQTSILDDSFQIGIQVLQYEIQALSRGEYV